MADFTQCAKTVRIILWISTKRRERVVKIYEHMKIIVLPDYA